MLAIIDYGVGNLFSLSGSLGALGIDSQITAEPAEIAAADHLILPGVGAFGDARAKLDRTGALPSLLEAVKRGTPLLGICLGMQLLFDESLEYGVHAGLGLLAGRVVPIADDLEDARKVPHMGWNELVIAKPCPILKYTKSGEHVYYVHSFYARDCAGSTAAWSDYGVKIPGVVQKDNVFGTQFHPEKSGVTGLNILKAFAEL
ncbi:MAG: imidazole glycerol phosphate synthase subunit HisH [Oscillospiraceae bacterium]|jgi:glutamine amidotransferase|nr:imidazole glycerol phosphate synthase subunit HisH [Oscillospiraceae bacterium]